MLQSQVMYRVYRVYSVYSVYTVCIVCISCTSIFSPLPLPPSPLPYYILFPSLPYYSLYTNTPMSHVYTNILYTPYIPLYRLVTQEMICSLRINLVLIGSTKDDEECDENADILDTQSHTPDASDPYRLPRQIGENFDIC